jgi:nucleotide-binding universal stress UspA family protein
LERHGVQANALMPPAGRNGKGVLAAILEMQECDLIVAGAYGHSRVREWAFGGVTRDLLMQPRCCALVSH